MSSKLLIQEPPLQVLPTLAKLIGLNEAIVLQQLHYHSERSPIIRRGPAPEPVRWVSKTLDEWTQEFIWWSKRTIQRIFDRLLEQDLIWSHQFDANRGNMTNSYAVRYDHVDKLTTSPPNGGTPCGQNGALQKTTDCPHVEDDNLAPSLFKERDVEEQQQADDGDETSPGETEQSIQEDVVVESLESVSPRSETIALLQQCGVTTSVAVELVRECSDIDIQRQVAHLDWLRSQGKQIRNPGGQLVSMIREAWALPPAAQAAYRQRFAPDSTPEPEAPPPPVPPSSLPPPSFDLDFERAWEDLDVRTQDELLTAALEQVDDETKAAYDLCLRPPRPEPSAARRVLKTTLKKLMGDMLRPEENHDSE